jgi:hypothetical protein
MSNSNGDDTSLEQVAGNSEYDALQQGTIQRKKEEFERWKAGLREQIIKARDSSLGLKGIYVTCKMFLEDEHLDYLDEVFKSFDKPGTRYRYTPNGKGFMFNIYSEEEYRNLYIKDRDRAARNRADSQDDTCVCNCGEVISACITNFLNGPPKANV